MEQRMKIPSIQADADGEKWDTRAITYDCKRYDYFRFMQRLLLATINFKAPASFLDLGCGTGWAVRYVASKLNGNGIFIGIDLSEGMIEKAVENVGGLPNVEFFRANAEELPFRDGYFDIIVCSNSFHHYPHPEKALKEAQRVLKPTGRISILDITADDFFIRCVDANVRRKEREHIKFYSTKEYEAMMSRVGLIHNGSHVLGVFYPLKVHGGEKQK
jgi:ubiquinone/menaquinone biosynthesis C-methylase UbiE